jgi:hypothetical protein
VGYPLDYAQSHTWAKCIRNANFFNPIYRVWWGSSLRIDSQAVNNRNPAGFSSPNLKGSGKPLGFNHPILPFIAFPLIFSVVHPYLFIFLSPLSPQLCASL